MSQKKDIPKRLRHCVLICESLYNDYQSTSPFAEVGNNPAIDYTLHWLNQQGFEEVFLFYSSLKTQVEQYHQKFQKSFDMKIKLNFMKAGELRSFGDVIRQAHFRNLVSQDFLVMYADTLVNLDLSLMIQTHFEKKVELKNVVLTTAMRVANSPHLMLLNANTSQILQIQQGGKQFSINTEKVNLKKVNIEFRRNLVPADIFICTIQILNSFKQTHQYTTMHDFIVGMLTSEVYEQKIIAYELKPQQIALRINKSYTTYLVHMNYICGYLFPYSPYSEDRLSRIQRNGTDKFFAVSKYHKIYRKGAKVCDSSQLSNNCYIGQNSKIEQNCNIVKTVIGKKSIVGKNSVLKRCVILDDVVLAQNSHFEDCLLQKVSQTLKIHSFKSQLEDQKVTLIQREIFETTPQPQQVTFQEQLRHLLSDKPQEQTILVSELVRIRKEFQKSQAQLCKEILLVLAPKGIKGVQSFTDQWGTILLKIHHDQESQAIDSLYFSCTQIQDYLKAFHLFLQYFYHYQVFSKQVIIEWLKASLADNPTPTMKLCAPFLQKLETESDEEEDDEQDS